MNNPSINGNSISIPSSLKYLVDVDNFVEGKLRDWGADDSIIADIAISVSELVTNSVRHGNAKKPEDPVIIKVELKGKSAVITINDSGDGFDPEEIANPLDEKNLLKDTGRGIFIVKSLMDDVKVSHDDSGTEVIISKVIK